MSVCPSVNCQPVWPSNTSNELLHRQQRLFNRDNHNHDQVLGEKTYNLPLDLPGNGRASYITEQGQLAWAPQSTDNIMHTNWVPYRTGTNLNTPWGSDSDIYFDRVQAPAGSLIPGPVTLSAPMQTKPGYNAYLDWLDQPKDAAGPAGQLGDAKITQTCADTRARTATSGQICSPTCVDWWTNRIVNPQGSLMSNDGTLAGGCPFGTTRALTCYPCHVHQAYNKSGQLYY